VGVSNDAEGIRWPRAGQPRTNQAEVLGFPGDWSQAFQVNNFGIAVVSTASAMPAASGAVAIH